MSFRDFPSVNAITATRIAFVDNDGESRSGSDDIDATNIRPGGKKLYQRHTPKQIEELEALFKECPHPDEKQRLKLSKRLGLDAKQVKFWFQNRRTQLKNQMERHENSILRNENNKLRAENIAVKQTMRNPICRNCGGPAVIADISMEEQHLRIENARLKDEVDRLRALTGKFLNSAIESSKVELSSPPMEVPAALHRVNFSADKSVLLELALTAMDELVKLVQTNDPLWLKNIEGLEVLNQEAYNRTFSPCIGPKPPNFVTEASRDIGMVIINSFSLVETLMSPDRWAEMFPCMLGRASTIDVIFNGIDNAWNGALYLMQAEFRLLSPMVPAREMNFIRLSKRLAEGLWAVVDVSIDHLRQGYGSSCYFRSRRLPSGCVVQDMPNGYSKVTWVEHTEYDESEIHELYRPVIVGGMGFGACRWVAGLQRQCECLAVLTSSNLPGSDPSTAITAGGRKSMLKLARRMTESFCDGVCTSPHHNWNNLAVAGMNNDDIRVMTRKSTNYPGEPSGVVLCAATSVGVPVLPERLFDFIRDERLRCQWDILSNGDPMQEMALVSQGHHPGNSVSLLRATALNKNQGCMLILQETSIDAAGALVVYAPVDVAAMHVVMNGGESTCVALLPSGFAILPGPRNGGSLLTVAFQILVNGVASSKLTFESVQTVNNLISSTIHRLKAAIGCRS